ncbi:MAG: TPM domain-containing protein [Flavobacteriales bacterium]|nr:TPM domain-containing protein [Flavobacteriales bacterium]
MSLPTAERFLTDAEKKQVKAAIAAAELRTSGEIRVHLEDHIEEDVLDHAAFVFEELDMHRTRDRNGVLIYLSVVDRKVAVIGDAGINAVVPEGFWTDVVAILKLHLAAGHHGQGIAEAVHHVGEKLVSFFPLLHDDTDELPNEISYGKR